MKIVVKFSNVTITYPFEINFDRHLKNFTFCKEIFNQLDHYENIGEFVDCFNADNQHDITIHVKDSKFSYWYYIDKLKRIIFDTIFSMDDDITSVDKYPILVRLNTYHDKFEYLDIITYFDINLNETTFKSFINWVISELFEMDYRLGVDYKLNAFMNKSLVLPVINIDYKGDKDKEDKWNEDILEVLSRRLDISEKILAIDEKKKVLNRVFDYENCIEVEDEVSGFIISGGMKMKVDIYEVPDEDKPLGTSIYSSSSNYTYNTSDNTTYDLVSQAVDTLLKFEHDKPIVATVEIFDLSDRCLFSYLFLKDKELTFKKSVIGDAL